MACAFAAGAATGCGQKVRTLQTAALVPALLATGAAVHAAPQFRPPSVPLVASDPYLSVWSPADHLNDTGTQHWTHHPASLVSLIRIDGKAYRLMGYDPTDVPAFPQTGLQVTATRSIYQFEDSAIHVSLSFMTPSLPHDLNVLARPVTYLTWSVRSVDGRPHAVLDLRQCFVGACRQHAQSNRHLAARGDGAADRAAGRHRCPDPAAACRRRHPD